MTYDPKTKTDTARTPDARKQSPGSESGGGQTSTSPSKLTQGDPVRRPFGDRSADVRENFESNEDAGDGAPTGGQTDEGGGEYDRGARAEGSQPGQTKSAPDKRSNPMQQKDKPSPQPAKNQPGKTDDKSGSDSKNPGKGTPWKQPGKSGAH